MNKTNLHKSLAAKSLLAVIALLMVTEPAWAILGVWRRTAVRTAVVVGSVSSADAAKASAANANAAASEAASAAAAQQSAAESAAAAQKAAAAAANPPKTPQQKLKDLQSLYDQGLISASEYQASKQKILNEMTQ